MVRALRNLAGVAVVWMAASVVAVGQEGQEEAAKVDPTGTWKWERAFGENTMQFTLRIKRQDEKLSGQLLTRRGEDEIPPAELEDLKLAGNKLSFAITREFNDQEFTIDYAGTVTDDAIDGTATADFGGNAREFPWQAKRGLDWEDVVGTWTVQFQTRDGDTRESTLKLASEGDKATGTLTSDRFGERELSEVAIQDGHLTFALVGDRNGNEFRLNYKVQPRGDNLKGTVQFGEDGTPREFSGTREKAAEETQKADEDSDGTAEEE
jgi:hypothetical protein